MQVAARHPETGPSDLCKRLTHLPSVVVGCADPASPSYSVHVTPYQIFRYAYNACLYTTYIFEP